MKKLFFCLLLGMSVTGGFAESFTIHGQIKGVMPGDTLHFERFVLPRWETHPAFDVVVEKPNEFTYSGTQEHTEYFLITYKPVDGREVEGEQGGFTLLVDGGNIRVSGNTESLYYCDVTGGLYDNTLLQQARHMQEVLFVQRSELTRLQNEAAAAHDSVKAKDYSDRVHALSEAPLDSLNRALYERYPSSIHTVVHWLTVSDFTPLDTLQARYGKMNEEARAGYYGKLLKREMDKLAGLTPGNTAPDFCLTTLDGREISLQDCAGKYLLLYRWGACPASMQLDHEVIALYEHYQEHLMILGITPSMAAIHALDGLYPAGSTIFGLDWQAIVAGMLAHPWPDGEEKTGDNAKISVDYGLTGFPFSVFISPDGKILARGFFEGFYAAKNRMETEFGK